MPALKKSDKKWTKRSSVQCGIYRIIFMILCPYFTPEIKVHSFLNQCCAQSSVDSILWSFKSEWTLVGGTFQGKVGQ